VQVTRDVELPRRGEWRDPSVLARSSKGAAGLLEPGVDAVPVRVRIQQDGVETGSDEGAAGVDEGALWFSGRTCSFRIAGGDIVAQEKSRGIGLRHPGRKIYLFLEVLVTEGRKEWEDENSLREEVERIRRNPAEGVRSQYPPLMPGPGRIVKRHRWARYRMLFFVAAAVLFYLPWEADSMGENISRAATVMCLLLFFLTAENPNQVTLKRIAREEADQ